MTNCHDKNSSNILNGNFGYHGMKCYHVVEYVIIVFLKFGRLTKWSRKQCCHIHALYIYILFDSSITCSEFLIEHV